MFLLEPSLIDPVQGTQLGFPVAKQPKTPLILRTILLAEDDDDLRYVMECVLTEMGFLVLSCPDAQRASELFRSHTGINALLTDFDMPGRTGFELAIELTSLHPSLPVVILTGSLLSEQTLKEIKSRAWTYISKPCNISTLEATLKKHLDHGVSSGGQDGHGSPTPCRWLHI